MNDARHDALPAPQERLGGPVRAAAAAKLNLYLHVVGRRPDGFHELDSLVAFVDVADAVVVRHAERLSLALAGPFAAALGKEDAADNLVIRAAERLAAALGRAPRVAIALDKRLPVASGIGGGSADGAACLRALARLWALQPDDSRLGAVAASLGADVPVCLAGRSAYLAGIGERLDPAPALPECHVVLANPGVPLPTAAVFRERSGPFSAPARLGRPVRDASELAAALAERRNDLHGPAARLCPAIEAVVAALAATPCCLLARLSGSGATAFGLYGDAAAAAAAARAVAAAEPTWWVRAGQLIADTGPLDRLARA